MTNVIFYECSADNKVVDKTSYLIQQSSKSCSFYNQTGVMHPSILIDYDSNIINNCNYFRIEEWGRFYYITGIEVMPGGRMIVTGSEDVLYSNKDSILALNAYVTRTEGSKSNSLLDDSLRPVQVNRHCKTLEFPGKHFNGTDSDYVYLLTVVGGSSRGD